MKRLALLTVAALAALLALAGPASAHVTVTAPGAVAGGSDQEITFRVPMEKNVDTVGFTIALPLDTPIADVLVEPQPGWTHSEKTTTLAKPIKTDDGDITSAVSQISWRAAGGGLKAGEFGAFTIIAGQLPDASELTFPAIQTYRDGSQVKWIETAAPGSTVQPQYPAPTLSLKPAASGKASTAVGTTKVEKVSTTAPTVLAIVALVVAAGALGLAVVNRAKATAS